MNPLLKSREVAYYLGDSGAKAVVAWHAAAGEAAKGAADAGAQLIAAETPDLSGLLDEVSPAPGSSGRGDARRRGHPVHLGDHRHGPRAPSSPTPGWSATPPSPPGPCWRAARTT